MMNTIVVKDSCCSRIVALWAVVLDISDTDVILRQLKFICSTRHQLPEFICYLLLICCGVWTRLKLTTLVLTFAWELRR